MSARLVVGIDADTMGLAWCGLAAGKVVGCAYVQRRVPGRSKAGVFGEERVLATYDAGLKALAGAWAELGAEVWMEDAYLAHGVRLGDDGVMPQRVKGFRAHCGALGEIRMALRNVGVRCWMVEASTWRREVLGGGLIRDEVNAASLRLAREEGGLGKVWDVCEHRADAYCVARYGAGAGRLVQGELLAAERGGLA